jgi:tRNA(fMet)-specific endonuclease VapC
VIYLLDTNAAVALLKKSARERPRAAAARQGPGRGAGDIVDRTVRTLVWRGAQSATRQEFGTAAPFLSGDLTTIQFDEQDAPIAGDLRRTLEAAGTPIGAYDLLIAAQALRTGATLVTANVAEFARVPGLAWEDWG